MLINGNIVDVSYHFESDYSNCEWGWVKIEISKESVMLLHSKCHLKLKCQITLFFMISFRTGSFHK